MGNLFNKPMFASKKLYPCILCKEYYIDKIEPCNTVCDDCVRHNKSFSTENSDSIDTDIDNTTRLLP